MPTENAGIQAHRSKGWCCYDNHLPVLAQQGCGIHGRLHVAFGSLRLGPTDRRSVRRSLVQPLWERVSLEAHVATFVRPLRTVVTTAFEKETEPHSRRNRQQSAVPRVDDDRSGVRE